MARHVNINLIIITIFLSCCFYISKNPNFTDKLPPPENEIFARIQRYSTPSKKNHDVALTCGQLIVSRGFKYETHFVTTEDGYILQMYRIINPYAQQALIPVLLVHGTLGSCSSWMFNGYDGFIESWIDGKPAKVASNNLAFVLANREFDVWLAINRGTSYTMNHTHLNPDTDSEFWNFTFYDMAKYDIPAMFEYIINETKHEKVVYIGQCRGSEEILIQLAENPSFAHKMHLNINLAPLAFRGNPKGTNGINLPSRADFLAKEGINGPVPPSLAEYNAGLSQFCSSPLFKHMCSGYILNTWGPDRELLDEDLIEVYASQLDTTSIKDIMYAAQSIYYDQIHYYDYGDEKNMQIYGSRLPPPIPFQNVPTSNLVLISGLNDYAVTPERVQKLRDILNGTAYVDHVVEWPLWSHTDYILGNKAYEYSHSVIVKIIRDYFTRQSG